jgi:hypothetical protein
MSRGATHSFRLSPRACDYIDALGDGRAKHKKGKSAWCSDAIIWFFSSPLYTVEYDLDGEKTGKLCRAGAGTPSPIQLIEQIEALEAELAALKGQNDAPPPPWWRRFLP